MSSNSNKKFLFTLLAPSALILSISFIHLFALIPSAMLGQIINKDLQPQTSTLQFTTRIQMDGLVNSVELCSFCVCITEYLTLFCSPERTYNVVEIVIYLNLIHHWPCSFRWMKQLRSFGIKASVTSRLWTVYSVAGCVCVQECTLYNNIYSFLMPE